MNTLLAYWFQLTTHLTTRLTDPAPGRRHPDRDRGDAGQATAEYALVLLGAALVALLLVAWATGGGGGKIGQLLDTVVDSITSRI